MKFPISRLYAIIDAAQAAERGRQPDEVAEILLAAGVKLMQYRDKAGSSRCLFETSRRLVELIRPSGRILIVNDRSDVALTAGAHGVHLGQTDLAVELSRLVLGQSMYIGVSTHTLEQVREAERTSADYVAFGPIFSTASKDNPDPVVGLEGLKAAREATTKPLVAIGGITVDRARSVIEAGADSVAVIGDLLRVENVGRRAREFLSVLESDSKVV